MTPTRFICSALLALVALSVVRPVLAEDAPVPTEDAEPSTEEMIQDLPPKQQEAAAEERVRRDVPGEDLHPKGEDELMGDHIVDRGDIKFRPGKGVEINSADDEFQLRIRVRVQMLYTYVHDENLGTNEGDEPEANLNDFRIRRASSFKAMPLASTTNTSSRSTRFAKTTWSSITTSTSRRTETSKFVSASTKSRRTGNA